MSDKQIVKNLQNLLEEKYEPILVVYLLRVPPQEELKVFAQKLSADFGYKVLVLPGDIETKVEILSVIKNDVTKIESLQQRVLQLIQDLEKEYSESLQPVGVTIPMEKDLSTATTTT
jgi:hypothetical protein